MADIQCGLVEQRHCPEGAADFFGAIFTLTMWSNRVKSGRPLFTRYDHMANVNMAPKKSAAPSGRRLCSTSPHWISATLLAYSLPNLIYRQNPPWRYSPRGRVRRPRKPRTSWTSRLSAAGSAGSAPRLSSSICRTWRASSAGSHMTHSRWVNKCGTKLSECRSGSGSRSRSRLRILFIIFFFNFG